MLGLLELAGVFLKKGREMEDEGEGVVWRDEVDSR